MFIAVLFIIINRIIKMNLSKLENSKLYYIQTKEYYSEIKGN